MEIITVKGLWLQFDSLEWNMSLEERIRESLDLINKVLADNDESCLSAQIIDADGSIESRNYQVEPMEF